MYKRLNICSIQDGNTAIHLIVKMDHAETINKLMNAGYDVNAVDKVSLIIIFCIND